MSLPPQYQQIQAAAEAGKADAQLLLSQICLQHGDNDGMLRWLRAASAQDLPDAHAALGHSYEKGLGVRLNVSSALEHYDRAIAGGSSLATCSKAGLLYKSRQGAEHNDLTFELLFGAARADVVPALRSLGYLAMQRESSRDLALVCLRRAARLGDPASSFCLGWFLMNGGSDDESTAGEALHCLRQAADSDYPFANELLSSIQDADHAVSSASPEEEIPNAEPFDLYPEPMSGDPQVISTDPEIMFFEDVLNVADCAYLIYLARPYMKRAHVIDPEGDKSGMVSKVRTSMSTYLPFEIVDIIGRYIELKIIRETGEDLALSEPMSILHYAPGEYYRPHFDYFNPRLKVSKEFFEDGGQRTASAVTYLSAPSVGGGTSFPTLDISVPPMAGGTLWFRNCLETGEVDPRSLHAGDTVEVGEKWVVTKWFREEPTHYLQL